MEKNNSGGRTILALVAALVVIAIAIGILSGDIAIGNRNDTNADNTTYTSEPAASTASQPSTEANAVPNTSSNNSEVKAPQNPPQNEISKEDEALQKLLTETEWKTLDTVFDASGEFVNAQYAFGSMVRGGAHADFKKSGTFTLDFAMRGYEGEWEIKNGKLEMVRCDPESSGTPEIVFGLDCKLDGEVPVLLVAITYDESSQEPDGTVVITDGRQSSYPHEETKKAAQIKDEPYVPTAETDQQPINMDSPNPFLYAGANGDSNWYFVEKAPDGFGNFIGIFTFYDGTLEFIAGYLDSEILYDGTGTYQSTSNSLSFDVMESGISLSAQYSVSSDGGSVLLLTQTSSNGLFYYHGEGHVVKLHQGRHP